MVAKIDGIIDQIEDLHSLLFGPRAVKMGQNDYEFVSCVGDRIGRACSRAPDGGAEFPTEMQCQPIVEEGPQLAPKSAAKDDQTHVHFSAGH